MTETVIFKSRMEKNVHTSTEGSTISKYTRFIYHFLKPR